MAQRNGGVVSNHDFRAGAMGSQCRRNEPGDVLGGVVELVFGVKAERKSFEDIAAPLSAVAVQRAA